MIGLDTNILVYFLDPKYPENKMVINAISKLENWYTNPTAIHETYHTLVFISKMKPSDARKKLVNFINDSRTIFINQTKTTTSFCLALAEKYNLGGRDSLIIGCYLHNKIAEMWTNDKKIINLKGIKLDNREIKFRNPIS
ncbi:MAG: type II toxin-antitoxin system VapC family toxin [Euryarchaeota archaeon]|nr:type II toxin-antitoxin system VapC family toxin [Euryarchaeota archaeon]